MTFPCPYKCEITFKWPLPHSYSGIAQLDGYWPLSTAEVYTLTIFFWRHWLNMQQCTVSLFSVTLMSVGLTSCKITFGVQPECEVGPYTVQESLYTVCHRVNLASANFVMCRAMLAFSHPTVVSELGLPQPVGYSRPVGCRLLEKRHWNKETLEQTAVHPSLPYSYTSTWGVAERQDLSV